MGKLAAISRLGMAAAAGYEISEMFEKTPMPIVIRENSVTVSTPTAPINEQMNYYLLIIVIIFLLIVLILFFKIRSWKNKPVVQSI